MLFLLHAMTTNIKQHPKEQFNIQHPEDGNMLHNHLSTPSNIIPQAQIQTVNSYHIASQCLLSISCLQVAVVALCFCLLPVMSF